ncbi:hypothetical protein ALP26_03339 [Pseudomonas savastanoi pv. glycinea]|uniref:Uncharacterized protein n=2 Tax=Pseudomonas savastanoi pv. glycinea TaxID=318 RepID=A0A0P9S1A8_PSESG|nr:hypothetical protein ALO37_101986 [Pseudomonas savastanoi pv. glycinea]RMN03976.1 hypothetical protein ALQ69_04049 [Pseudomonas savastanoi pv. glycinea]RMO33209.1 hypothetical protein ALQ42_101939 [Pseudomonas savastanoi pv. glycinea]RMO39775.1 hypothetical protein ALQ43_04238 [Pseudomonas savastanoi pv. glycinea]RMO42099.1 hypothetical protein ALQ41_102094 [Pseudomonas savastanoi pv. glycinea]
MRLNFEEMKMDYRLESEIWLAAQRHMTNKAFLALIEQAVRTYRRRPGHYPLERMHAVDVGVGGIDAMKTSRIGGVAASELGSNFISVRAPLREHLYRALQENLIESSLASPVVVDNYMAIDLGL